MEHKFYFGAAKKIIEYVKVIQYPLASPESTIWER